MPSSTSLSSIRADAIARRDRGDLNSARALLERALEAATMTSGEDHPEVLITAHLLAKLHRQAGDLSGARRVLENALYAGSHRHGDDHPMLLSISFDLAEIADELGNRHESRKHYTRIARFGPGAPGFDQQQVQAARAWLGPSAPAAAPIQGQPVTLPAPEPIVAPPPFIPPAPEPVTEAITTPPVTEWPPIPAPPPAEPIRPLPPVHEERPETVLPPPPPPLPPAEPRRVTPIPPRQPLDQRPVAPPVPPLDQRPASPEPPALQRPVSPPPPVLPPSRHSALPVDPAPSREPQYPPAAGSDLPGRGVTGYPQTTVPPLVISTPPGPAAPLAPQPKRGRGILIASLTAAVVAVAAAGVTVFLVLGPKAKEPNPTPTGPDGAPTGVALLDRGDRITLTWTDTSNGSAQPIVVGNREDEQPQRLQVPTRGSTEVTLLSLNKNYEYCFSIVLVYSADDLRQSEQVCTNRKKASPSPTR